MPSKNPYYYPEPLLAKCVDPHVGSFDYFIGDGLTKALADLDPVRIELPDGKALSGRFTCV